MYQSKTVIIKRIFHNQTGIDVRKLTAPVEIGDFPMKTKST